MVQAAAQAQAVVNAAKAKGGGLVPMNSAEIAELSQIQANAIVNARPSAALIAVGKSEKDGLKPTPEMIQNQIQVQAQALVHAHTQAQIAAGIYKGNVSNNTGTVRNPIQPPLKKTKYDDMNKPGMYAKPLDTLTAPQMKHQNDVTRRQNSQLAALMKKHEDEIQNLLTAFQSQNLAATPSPALIESQKNEIATRKAKNAREVEEKKQSFAKELQELQNEFRRQNAAAEYAGVPRGATVPNPVKDLSIVGTSAAIGSNNMHVTSLHHPGNMMALGPDAESNSSITNITNTALDPPNFKLALHSSLKKFWGKQLQSMQELPVGTEQDFKNHNDLPLARIKRIMKSDEDVRMISAEAPVLFAKACELFILELSLRSWAYSEGNKRRTLQKEDIQTAIRRTDIFDFLVDVIN